MLVNMNLEMERGKDGVFEVPLSQGSESLDISGPDAVRVDVFRLGALQDEAAVVECTEANGRIEKVVTSGTEVKFKFLIPKAVSSTLPAGDYRWKERDVIDGLETETIGGVLTVT